MNTINWSLLVETGRAKAHGVAWSEAEALARQAGVPAEHVRKGILTVEESRALIEQEEAVEAETGEKPVEKMKKAELQAKATELGIEFTPDATNAVLVDLIKQALAGKKESDEDSDEEGEGKKDNE